MLSQILLRKVKQSRRLRCISDLSAAETGKGNYLSVSGGNRARELPVSVGNMKGELPVS